MSLYPEHEKLSARKEDAHLLGEFLESLYVQGVDIRETDYPKYIAAFLGIDKDAFDAETEALYKRLRERARQD